MVWEQEVYDIVMLTQLTERGVQKCYQYWGLDSNSSIECNEFKVHTREIKHGNGYQMSRLDLVNYKTQELRQITHWWYKNWPDQGIPCTKNILEFAKQINMQRNRLNQVKDTPLTVHCSAGIGRAGTFIALNNCLSELYHTGQINVARAVRTLRNQRAYCVCTKSQYRLIYKILFAWAKYYMNINKVTAQKICNIIES